VDNIAIMAAEGRGGGKTLMQSRVAVSGIKQGHECVRTRILSPVVVQFVIAVVVGDVVVVDTTADLKKNNPNVQSSLII
jgi:hypothetical protein